MTSRFILILLAMLWSAYATAAEVVNEPEHDSQWLSNSASISADDKQSEQNINKKSPATAKQQQNSKNKRSRLDGMFDLLLPSGLRDNQ